MKKVFRLTALATLVLPFLLVSCNHFNPVDNPTNSDEEEKPQTQEEELEDWTTPVDSLVKTVNLDDLTGIWKEAYTAVVRKDSTRPDNSSNESNHPDQSTYLELKKDFTYKAYYYYKETVVNGDQETKVPLVQVNSGKWTVKDFKHLILEREDGWKDESDIYFLEEERLVLTQTLDIDGNGTIATMYAGYVRVNELPELPKAPNANLTAYSWRLTSDTLKIYNIEDSIDGNNHYTKEVYAETRKNQFPAKCVFEFRPNYMLFVKDANGSELGQYTWFDFGDSNPTYKYLEIKKTKGDLDLPEYINVSFDMLDESKAYITARAQVEEEDSNGDYHRQLWIYILNMEAVK